MAAAFIILLIVHALIHLLGAAKAFGWVELPRIAQPVPPVLGLLWLASAVLFLAAALALVLWPRVWWLVAGIAAAVSMTVIVSAWEDARFGMVGNVLVFAGVVFGFLSQGPFSLRAQYESDVARRVSAPAAPMLVTDADLEPLPAPVQRYLRLAGVVGQPRVRTFQARLHGRIRSGRKGRWMPFSAEQYTVVDPPARLFYLTASMFGIPVQGYHRYADSAASMHVKAAALVPVAAAAGREMTQSETVTMFNDMCLMAPATLIDPAITWQTVDARTVRASFTNAGHTIHAELWFNDAGELANFVSDDRYAASSDGTLTRRRWSTPVWGYRQYGAVRLFSRGEGRWHDENGEYAYIELTLDDVRYNVGAEEGWAAAAGRSGRA